MRNLPNVACLVEICKITGYFSVQPTQRRSEYRERNNTKWFLEE